MTPALQGHLCPLVLSTSLGNSVLCILLQMMAQGLLSLHDSQPAPANSDSTAVLHLQLSGFRQNQLSTSSLDLPQTFILPLIRQLRTALIFISPLVLWKSHAAPACYLRGRCSKCRAAQSEGHRWVSNTAPKTWASEGNEGLLNETGQLGGLLAPEEVEITFWRSKVGQNSCKL